MKNTEKCPICGKEMQTMLNYSYRPIKEFYICDCGYSEEIERK